jgi:hypothetical protein
MPPTDLDLLVALAAKTADRLIYGERDGADEDLGRLANMIYELDIPDGMGEKLARYAHRPLQNLPLWLRGTAALCLLVRAREESDDELVPRLAALSWGLGDEGRVRDDALRADDVELLQRYAEFTARIAVERFEKAFQTEQARSSAAGPARLMCGGLRKRCRQRQMQIKTRCLAQTHDWKVRHPAFDDAVASVAGRVGQRHRQSRPLRTGVE